MARWEDEPSDGVLNNDNAILSGVRKTGQHRGAVAYSLLKFEGGDTPYLYLIGR